MANVSHAYRVFKESAADKWNIRALEALARNVAGNYVKRQKNATSHIKLRPYRTTSKVEVQKTNQWDKSSFKIVTFSYLKNNPK